MIHAASNTLHPCCRPRFQPQQFSYLRLAEQISIVALGALAAYANFSLFSSFLLLGCSIGVYQHLYAQEGSAGRADGISCSQGFLEQLTRVKLPPLVSLGVNLAITWSHIEHHANIFVPIIALSIGAEIGQKVSEATHST